MTLLKTFDYKGKALKLIVYDVERPKRPARKTTVRRAPGAGKFEIAQLEISGADEELTFKAEISGKNIAYLFVEVLMKDGEKFYGPVLREYIPATQDKEIGGVKHPEWSDPISLSIPLRPRLTLLADGVDSAFAFVFPLDYGISGCRLEGQYTNSETQTRAQITFNSEGKVTKMLAFKKRGFTSTPRALVPEPGDIFAPFVQVLTEEDGAWTSETVLSTPLTFGNQPFRLEKESLLPGEYLVGILVQDLDGGFTRKYTSLTI